MGASPGFDSRINNVLGKAPTMGAGDENNMEIFSSEYAQLRQLAAKYLANERENPLPSAGVTRQRITKNMEVTTEKHKVVGVNCFVWQTDH